MRQVLRGLIRGAAIGFAALAVISSPITVTVDFDAPVKPLPLASTLLVIGSSSLLAAAGIALHHRERGALRHP